MKNFCHKTTRKLQMFCLPCMKDYQRENVLRSKYGITLEQYDAMHEKQAGVCYICEEPEATNKLAVDHCHSTGVVRKLLCVRCNTALGMFKDNPTLMHKAADYIRAHQ